MIRSLYTSATGMTAQEANIDVIANNLANVNTVGFKKSRADFQDLIYQYLIEPGAPTSESTTSPSGIQIGLGVRLSTVQKLFQQGDLSSTGNQLDIAIEGDGMFEVLLPDGTSVYTRAGNFQLDSEGQVVTTDGYPLNPAITIDTEALSISIGEDGIVTARIAGESEPAVQGTLTGVRFANSAGLRAIGRNLFEQTTSSGDPITGNFSEDGFGRLSQGFLEGSNVSIVQEVVNMITGQRAYEASSKGIQTADDMLNQAINLKR